MNIQIVILLVVIGLMLITAYGLIQRTGLYPSSTLQTMPYRTGLYSIARIQLPQHRNFIKIKPQAAIDTYVSRLE